MVPIESVLEEVGRVFQTQNVRLPTASEISHLSAQETQSYARLAGEVSPNTPSRNTEDAQNNESAKTSSTPNSLGLDDPMVPVFKSVTKP
jgi:hypothetical protein